MKLESGFPCSVTESVFGSVDSFVTFVKYIVQEEHLENEGGTFHKFPEHPAGIPLLLTADNILCQFLDSTKVVCSEFASIFDHCGGNFLHPEMFRLKLIPKYFIEPSKENWVLIKGILRRTLPKVLTVERVRNAGDHIDIKGLLNPLWKCLFKEDVFKTHVTDILQEWALILSKEKELFSLKSSEKILPVIPPRKICLLYTSPSPRDATLSRMPSSA